MLSWKLWRALSKPPKRHPLFHYVLIDAKREQPRVTSGFVVWAMMLVVFIFTFTVLIRPLTWIILSVLVALNSIYAARWVLRITKTLAQEKSTRRYDLLASLPIGLLGTSWALSTGVVNRRSSFRWMPYLVLVVAIVSFIALCGLSTLTLTLLETLSDTDAAMLENLAFARGGIAALPFIILFYIDHIYSILTAIVFGQLITIDVENVAEGQIRGLFGFLAIQVLIYMIGIGLLVFAIPQGLSIVELSNVQHLIWMSMAGILLFVILREFVLSLLWRSLVRLLDADQKEIALVLKPFYEAEQILRESEKARARYMDAAR